MAENVEQVLKELYEMNFVRASRNSNGLFRFQNKELFLVCFCVVIKKVKFLEGVKKGKKRLLLTVEIAVVYCQ